MRYLKYIFLTLFLMFPLSVFAEEGQIEINYYDDSAMTSPVNGSTWRLYKVADIVTIIEDNKDDVHRIVPCIDDLVINKDTKAEEVLELLDYEKLDESTIIFNDEEDSINYDLWFQELTTDEDGKLQFKELSDGVYLGVEVKASDYHMLSSPFLVSLPNTNDTGDAVSMKYKIEPKAVLAGNLKVSKELHGDNTESHVIWDMEVTLPEGTYRYEISNGDTGYIQSGDKIGIKGGENFVIYDILANAKYEVNEVQENHNGYQTSYEGQNGTIVFKEDAAVIVSNSRSHIVNTGVFGNFGNNNHFYLIGGSFLVILVSIIIYKKFRSKQEDR